MTKTIYAAICILVILIMHYISQKKTKQIENHYKESIMVMKHAYESQIESYKSQITSLKTNNIVSTKTIYLPSGVKIVDRVVDRSVQLQTSVTDQLKVLQSVQIEDKVIQNELTQKTTEFSQNDYLIGFAGQPSSKYPYILDIYVNGGVRIWRSPFFLTTEFKVSSDFYKYTKIGVLMEL